MNYTQSAHSSEEGQALTNLIISNPDLDRLESMLSELNLFEAIGVIRQELKHSTLLAFLLSPNEKHGLGDCFLRKLLSTAIARAKISPLSALEINLADLSDVEVRREWRYIDLLIYSPRNRWVIAIENKVDSGERPNQLKNYEHVVETEFSNCEKKAFLYLTRGGDEASQENWRSLSYGTIADILENITAEHSLSISNDVRMLVRHYINLIRRHLVNDSEIAQLCRKIYRQHHQALNLIYEHRPDLQLEIADFLKTLIEETEGIEQEDSNKFFIRCVPTDWDKLSLQKTCNVPWTNSHRLVMFEFFNYADRLEFKLTIGPGEYANKKAIYDTVEKLNISGSIRSKLIPDGWSPLFCQNVLTSSDYFEEDWKDIQSKIREFWQRFLNIEKHQICAALDEIRMPLSVSILEESLHPHKISREAMLQ